MLCMCQNKSDLSHAEFNKDFAEKADVDKTGFVSALTGEGVQELFLDLCKTHIAHRKALQVQGMVDENIVHIELDSRPNTWGDSCCMGYV